MATPTLLLLLTTTILTFFASATAATTTTFIRTCCNSTTYPSLCVSALSPYAISVQNSPLQLALVATNVSLISIQTAANKSAALYIAAAAADPTSRKTKALRDCRPNYCRDVLRDAAGNTKYSASQLRVLMGMGTLTKGQRMWALSNAQTYMSAALTKEDTCIDGLKEMGVAAKSVSGKVVKAEKYTSNALGLVNGLRSFI